MRERLFAALLGLSIGASGCSAKLSPTNSPAHAGHGPSVASPKWLPPYTAAQQALLDDGADTPVQVPVHRVLPDLSRFGYSENRKLEDPAQSLRFTKLFATVVTESPHFYVITAASADVENAIVQYGPPGTAEPDAWDLVRRANGVAVMSKAPVSAEAKEIFERAKATAERDKAGAIQGFKDAISKSPEVPALWMALADTYAANGDVEQAEGAYAAVVTLDTTLATAHSALAEIHEKRGDLPKARREVAEALAYHPGSKRALAIADRLTHGGAASGRVQPYRVFLDVTGMGAVRVASTGGIPGQMYASCRAVLRYEPQIRGMLFESMEGMPYYLSAAEEMICLETAIGAYLFELRSREDAKSDPSVEQLIELARSEGLLGYAMFEILGQHRPDRARIAPPTVHEAMVEYVERHVLGEGQPLPDGIYNAMR